jgi:hypothetical protein
MAKIVHKGSYDKCEQLILRCLPGFFGTMTSELII